MNSEIIKILGILVAFILVIGGAFVYQHASQPADQSPTVSSHSDSTTTTTQTAPPAPQIKTNLPKLPVEGPAPEIAGIQEWLNSKPLTLKDLRGKVVLIDFWTYSCINCIRTLPYVRAWYEKYKNNGFVLIGVHTPEFDFEKIPDNVREAIKEYDLTYPVALDNTYTTWTNFANNYWPAHYLIDAQGNIRYHHFGEGNYAETETAIQSLLVEAGLLKNNTVTEAKEPAAGTDFSQIETPEIYLGYKRLSNIGNWNADVYADTPHVFDTPTAIEENKFYLAGDWTIAKESANFMDKDGKIIIRYKANKLNMVLDTADGAPRTVELKLDGQPLTDANKGSDAFIKNGRAFATIKDSRLYNLTDTKTDYGWHTLEIDIPTPGLRALTFTFG